MRKIIKITIILFLFFSVQKTKAQLYGSNSTGKFLTSYTSSSSNDTIYYFCSPTGAANVGSLYAEGPNSGVLYDITWKKYNPLLKQFITFTIANGVPNSTQSNLLSGGYQIQIRDLAGNLVGCYIAWVYVIDINLSIANLGSGCVPNSLSAIYSGAAVTNFQYYNPPPDPVIIDSNTIFEVCVKSNNDYISTLGVILEAPPACGSSRFTIIPHGTASNSSPSGYCNFGVGVDACFRSDLPANFDICALPFTTLSGVHGFGIPKQFNLHGFPTNDIYVFNGCNASQPGWRLQIIDLNFSGDTVFDLSLRIINPGLINCTSGSDTVVHDLINLNSPILDGLNGGDHGNTATSFKLNFSNSVNPAAIVYDYDGLLTAYQITNPLAIQWTTNNSVTFINPNVLTPVPTTPINQDTWFYFSMTDQLGCTFQDSVFFDYVSPQVDSFLVGQILCFGDGNGSITVFDTWASDYSIDLGSTWQVSNIFPNLGPGIYSVIIRDVLGTCFDTVNTFINEPAPLVVQVTSTGASCYDVCDGNAVAGVIGGVTPYNYNWSNGQTTGSFAINLCPDSMFIIVTDSNNCMQIDSFELSSPPEFTYNLTIDTTACTSNTGEICILNVAGATSPYGFFWDLNAGGGTDSCATGLASGLYSVTIYDDRSCDSSFIVDVPSYPHPQVFTNPASDTSVCEGSSVVLSATGLGGNTPYMFDWSESWVGPGTHNLIVNDSTCVLVKIIDSNGCESTQESICFFTYPKLNGEISGSSVCEGAFVDLVASATGGLPTSVYTYIWSDNLGSTNTVSVGAGLYPSSKEYSVAISDGCSQNDTIYITIPVIRPPIALFETTDSLDCYPQDVEFIDKSDNSITGTWDVGEAILLYKPGEKISHHFSNPGNYEVTLITVSPDGCLDTFRHEICIKESDRQFVPDIFSPNGNGFNDVFQVYAKNVSQSKLLIYDRWGEKVYESLSLTESWDGTFRGAQMPTGIYIYFLNIEFDDGQILNEKGDFTLLR